MLIRSLFGEHQPKSWITVTVFFNKNCKLSHQQYKPISGIAILKLPNTLVMLVLYTQIKSNFPLK